MASRLFFGGGLRRIGRLAVPTITAVLKYGCAALLFTQNVIGFRMMAGPSMLPTMPDTPSWIVEDMLTVRFNLRPLQRGDLVVVIKPTDPDIFICKRVIGLPGDIVCIDPTGEVISPSEHCLVPQGHIWIAGDNAAASVDSRYYGPVPIALVYSRVIARLFPWKSRTIFRNPMTVIGED